MSEEVAKWPQKLTDPQRFGGGFEMIRDGRDIHGNWDLIVKFTM